ncbi:MAG: nucleotidyltransferase family protein [Gammaproteobacteria bacterium]|nr:nucleotidyltransferase family protein [Gammaproteobacteria bacterium]MCZ6881698.1 nucleotidyltransferase family protein [Gammaproteobacteria bacterium]
MTRLVTKAMILAAGRGERLRPYTDTCPKPLLEIRGKPMIFYHLEALATAGFDQVVINVSWLGEMIEQAVGDGSRFNLKVVYSYEPEALETAGGIVQALEYLDDRFVVVNADVRSDYAFENLLQIETDAHLVLVKNPEFHPQGDFVLDSGLLSNDIDGRHTFAGIACYHRSFFNGLEAGRRSVVPLLRQAADNRSLSGELYEGNWTDIGTLDRWQAAKI